MKLICISDTHGKHKDLILPKGDMIIHAGDVSSRGSEFEIKTFLNWFSSLDFKYKIFIAGNHDFYFENKTKRSIKEIIPENVIYLNDSSINIEGLNIWGSPIQPEFFNWAFNRQRGEEILLHWNLIPNNIDILITHGPPLGILDRTIRDGISVGCEDLLNIIKAKKPKYHIFGHIHEAYGIVVKPETTFINASVLNERYLLVNKPITINL